MNNTQLGPLEPELTPVDSSLRGFWDILDKKPAVSAAVECPAVRPEDVLQEEEKKQEQEEEPVQTLPDPVSADVREPPEMKLMKQLAEVTRLLEQQTSILYTQQKLLEDLTGRQKKQKKRKPGMAKKLKTLIHKGKIIWSAL